MSGGSEEPEREQAQDEPFRTILEHAPVMIDSFDEEGTCVIWNRECVRQLGWTHEEVAGLDDPLSIFYPDPELLRTVHEDVQRADGVFREYQVLAKDGGVRTQVWANFRMPMTGSVIAVGHDVTEQRAVEAQLRQSQRLDALGQLTGGIAHDFNNLLTVILASAELLSRRVGDDAGAGELAQQIHQAATDGAQLVRQLGSFSRVRRLALAPLDLHRLLDELGPTLRRLLPASIEIGIEHAPGPLHVLADRSALEQIVVNLATNARDAIEGRGTIEITTRTTKGSKGKQAILSVRDSGRGMTPEVRDRVFDPFFTTKAPGKGTGLGLPSVYGLVRQHQGEVELSSRSGHGTLVEVRLPTIEPAEAPESPPTQRRELVGGTEQILLVEDDASARTTAARVLRHLGYRVLEAEDGASAVTILEATPDISLVISDVVMPRMSGPELLAHARASGRPMPAFAFSTAYTSRDTAATLDPSVPLLEKPWTLAVFADFVRRCLADHEP